MNGSMLLPATATEIRQPGPDEPSAFTVAMASSGVV